MSKKNSEKRFQMRCIFYNSFFLMSLFVIIMGCKKNNTQSINNELVIFHAGSLSVPFREISAEFNKQYPEIEIRAEAAGSRASARKICDL
ncbi:MAG: hypothetical protein ACYSOV_09090, partial [Planctomycetota bacterium]